MDSHSEIDPTTAERLLRGDMPPDDAPPGLAPLAGALQAAAETDPSGAPPADLLASMVAEIRSDAAPPRTTTQRRKSVLAKFLTAKVAAVAGVLALTATGAAAATGSLPDAAQDGLANAASHVGITLPQSGDHAGTAGDSTDVPDTESSNDQSTDSSDQSTESSDSQSTDSSDQSTESSDTGSSDASDSRDSESSDGPGGDTNDNHGAVVSDTARNTDSTGSDHGDAVSSVANDGHPNQDHPTSSDHPGNEDHPTSSNHP